MHIKRIHEMIEKLTECTKSALEENKSFVGDYPIGDVVDMIKDLCEAEKEARVAKQMEECEKEEKEEEKRMLRMLKEEHKDEYKRMREEYGEYEGERRFYDNYRYKSSGRFAPKGSGSYMPRSSGRRGRRGYEEMPYMHMYPEMYGGMSPEEMRDMDLDMNRMYYSGSYSSNSGGSSSGGSRGSSGGMSGGSSNMGSGNVRGYSDGYNDGYSEGERSGRSSQRRDYREGRSGQSRKRYFESKEENKGNSAEEKQKKMKELESYMKDIAEDLTEAIGDASNEERTLIKAKLQTLMQKM